jgi:hypothetical protein
MLSFGPDVLDPRRPQKTRNTTWANRPHESGRMTEQVAGVSDAKRAERGTKFILSRAEITALTDKGLAPATIALALGVSTASIELSLADGILARQ